MQSLDEIRDDILRRGLYDDGRPIYSEKYRPYFSKTGLWQQPDELSALLHYLQQKRVTSFLNIGTFNGNTFNFMADFLTRNNSDIQCVTVDIFDWPGVEVDSKYQYVIGTSSDFVGQQFDLVFIDGDHAYDASALDFENVGRTAKFCVFHDIDDVFVQQLSKGGCVGLWADLQQQLSATHTAVEFIAKDKPSFNMGIGLLVKNNV